MARRRRLRTLLHPARLIPIGFAAAVVVGTLALLTPVAVAQGATTDGTSLVVAAFTAVSAVCVTGLVLVDTGTYWSGAGQLMILVLIQVGGFGISTLATLLALLVRRRLGLRSRLATGVATRSAPAEARSVLAGIVRVTLVVEALVALALTLRFALGYGMSPGQATWYGVFHAVSAFNNAGFALPEGNVSLVPYATDEWVTVPVMLAVVLGGIGFPVLFEVLRRTGLPWAVSTRLVLLGTAVLLVGGALLYLVLEWDNPETLAGVAGADKVWLAVFMSVTARTAGFNTVDYGQVSDASLLLTVLLMFVGGGSGGTAGGIKVGTVMVLVAAIVAEGRGDPDAEVFGHRLSGAVIRQALAVIGTSGAVIATATIWLLHVSDARLATALFEVVSAFATVGLSTGITADLPRGGDVVLMVCMFIGRVGPTTAVAALALREHARLYRRPEAHPLVG